MKRLASIILPRRDKFDVSLVDSSDSNTTGRPGYMSKAPKALLDIPRPPATTPGSSSSSDGSSSLRTPDDDALSSISENGKRSRLSTWFGKRRAVGLAIQDTSDGNDTVLVPKLINNSDIDPSRSSEEVECVMASPISVVPIDESVITKSRVNFQRLLQNGLIPSQSSHPLLENSATAVYPRSSNLHRRLPLSYSLETDMHRRHLLKRLRRKNISPSEQISIISFGYRENVPIVHSQSRKGSGIETLAPGSLKVVQHSRGLRRWVMRPGFEDRVSHWILDDRGVIERRQIEGTSRGFAVASLEFSEYLEILANIDHACTSPAETSNEQGSKDTSKKSTGNASKKSVDRPSSGPRIHTDPGVTSKLSPTTSPATDASSPDLLLTPSPTLHRGVRFADDIGDDDGDDIPLALSLQSLRSTERRATAQKAQQGKERIYQTYGDSEDSEKDRRIRDEQQKLYVREVLAARQRRESQRLGAENFVNIRDQHAKQHEPSYSRPRYDAMRSSSRGEDPKASSNLSYHINLDKSPHENRIAATLDAKSGHRLSTPHHGESRPNMAKARSFSAGPPNARVNTNLSPSRHLSFPRTSSTNNIYPYSQWTLPSIPAASLYNPNPLFLSPPVHIMMNQGPSASNSYSSSVDDYQGTYSNRSSAHYFTLSEHSYSRNAFGKPGNSNR